ncbi:MAG: ferrous iron transport protein B [Thiohalomonadaceae bacterium]
MSAVMKPAAVPERPVVIAVAGNPNAGKSTLINGLAGTRLQVGNWPGVTVEKKEANLVHAGRAVRLVDLPGTYSLSPYTQEEVIARDYLLRERPDVIINVVDATNLERNLYLTVQLLELGIPVVLALNVYDEAERKGFRIDVPAMERLLGVRVIPTVATRNEGLAQLLETVLAVADEGAAAREIHYGNDIEAAVDAIAARLQAMRPELSDSYPLRWLAFKVMEGDSQVLEETRIADPGDFTADALHHLRQAHGEDMESLMADTRYGQAAGLAREVVQRPAVARTELTERIDRIVLNRFLGLPLFFAAMWLTFKLTFDVSTPFVDWIDGVTAGPLTRWADAALGAVAAPNWVVSLATEGLLSGVGFVLVFVPVIFAMMFFITFLEASGYMARAAFVMDRAMHAVGLHGKSFIPLLMGFGCNVPAVYATRTLENQRDRILTALLVPLMSCGARLPVYVLFAAVFFPDSAGTVLWSLYVLGIVLALLVGIVFKRTLFKGEAPMFIMELPPYRLPTLRSLLIHTWEKGKHFLVKAGTYILAVSVLVWFALNLPWGVEQKQDSVLGRAGQVMAPVFEPLGFGNWQAASSLLTGAVAKEIVIGTMGEIYAPEVEQAGETIPTFGEDLAEIGGGFLDALGAAADNVFATFGIASLSAEDESSSALRQAVAGAFTPLSAYAFMAFVLLYMPCVVTMIAMRQEFGTWKWAGVALGYEFALAWSVAFVIYQGGRLLGFQ